ncbi:MAG TPA: addiction module protein [Burkholderiaceae bacterium]|nr:addiction module protein [Burkholderiaceae bacterium]
MSAIPSELEKLSVAERIQLVEDLWDSIARDTPEALTFTEEQRTELRRRWKAHRDDPGSATSWEEVSGELLGPKA